VFDSASADMVDRLRAGSHERDARMNAERMALLLQGAVLLQHAPHAVSDAFVDTRINGASGRTFGAIPASVDVRSILARHPSL